MSFVFICACEKHHLGEMPEVQREHRIDSGTNEADAMKKLDERSTSSSPAPTQTPAEFFGGSKPR